MTARRAARKYALLVELGDGEIVAVLFDDMDEARDWEDAHDGELFGRGCIRRVTRAEALKG